MCVPCMGKQCTHLQFWINSKNTNLFYELQCVYSFPESENLLQASYRSLLASRKVALGDQYTEGSETAKSGTDEQKRHTEAICKGWAATSL